MKTTRLTPDHDGIAAAVRLWRGGGLVAFPTETVYGLGADATNSGAVAGIYRAKGRPSFNPLIIHVADLAAARRYAVFDPDALALADAFWPGPLSLVLPVARQAGLSGLVSAGLGTVAVRVPAHPLANRLLRDFGGAIAAPSANLSGRISPTSAAHVFGGLSGVIDAVMDGGDCAVGMESTIVMTGQGSARLLRPGGLPAEALQAALGSLLTSLENDAKPLSPGQLSSHYAPGAKLLLNQHNRPDQGLWLGFGRSCVGADLNLSVSGDMSEAAANLFAFLHRLDDLATAQTVPLIAVAPIPETGLGRAINDRLKRAAAPRT